MSYIWLEGGNVNTSTCKICNKELNKKCSWIPCQLMQISGEYTNETPRSETTSTIKSS